MVRCHMTAYANIYIELLSSIITCRYQIRLGPLISGPNRGEYILRLMYTWFHNCQIRHKIPIDYLGVRYSQNYLYVDRGQKLEMPSDPL
jgi:hypothetical protein